MSNTKEEVIKAFRNKCERDNIELQYLFDGIDKSEESSFADKLKELQESQLNQLKKEKK